MPGGPSGRGSDPAGAPSSPGLVLRVGSLPRDEIRQASSAGKHQVTDRSPTRRTRTYVPRPPSRRPRLLLASTRSQVLAADRRGLTRITAAAGSEHLTGTEISRRDEPGPRFLPSTPPARTPATRADCPCAAPCAAGSAAPAPHRGLRACAPSSPPATAAPRPLSIHLLRSVFPARAKSLSCELTDSRLWETNPFRDVAIFYSRRISQRTIQSDDPQIP